MKCASINEFFWGVRFLKIKFTLSKKKKTFSMWLSMMYIIFHNIIKKKFMIIFNFFSNNILLSTCKIYRGKEIHEICLFYIFIFISSIKYIYVFSTNIFFNLTANRKQIKLLFIEFNNLFLCKGMTNLGFGFFKQKEDIFKVRKY